MRRARSYGSRASGSGPGPVRADRRSTCSRRLGCPSSRPARGGERQLRRRLALGAPAGAKPPARLGRDPQRAGGALRRCGPERLRRPGACGRHRQWAGRGNGGGRRVQQRDPDASAAVDPHLGQPRCRRKLDRRRKLRVRRAPRERIFSCLSAARLREHDWSLPGALFAARSERARDRLPGSRPPADPRPPDHARSRFPR